MIEIIKPEEWTALLYGDEPHFGKYKLSNYAKVVDYDGGKLLLHTISWSLFYLTNEEFDEILDNYELKRCHAVVESDVDEDSIAERAFIGRSESEKVPDYKHLKTYVILTTTACNARCFYCYEEGITFVGMTIKTAEDVVKFIKETSDNKVIQIQWFGGEPLLNTKVIDKITSELLEDGYELNANFVTNGYLLNEKNVAKLEEWRIHSLQITIDGNEERYNKTKNYTVKDDSPFKTVIGNIHRVLDTSKKVRINIRVNATEENINELDELFSYLEEEFKDYMEEGRLRAYIAQEFSLAMKKCDDKREFIDLFRKIKEKHSPNKKFLKRHPLQRCMVDRGDGITISPEGKLYTCEHMIDCSYLGDIYSGITNNDAVSLCHYKGGDNIKFCKESKCRLLPMCLIFKFCPAAQYCRDEDYIKDREEVYSKLMIGQYEKMKNGGE